MAKIVKSILSIAIILCIFIFYQNSYADTYNAASCSSADVAAAISASSNGDIVNIVRFMYMDFWYNGY